MKFRLLEFIIPLIFLFIGCKSNTVLNNIAVVGISSDVKTIDPLYAFDVNEGNISELLFLSLVNHGWNSSKCTLTTEPMLAKSWEWSKDSSSIIFQLRHDVKWSDGKKVTAEDVVFSFDAYSDPAVKSRLYGTFGHFYTDSLNHINIQKTFNVISPYELKINFLPKSSPSIYDVDFPIIPKHVFREIPRKDFETADVNFQPVTSGAFKLKKWNKDQSIILESNPNSFLTSPGHVSEIVFKIIPGYASKLFQLKHGDINLMTDLQPDDVSGIKRDNSLKIILTKGRQYDYIGWNNIDPEAYNKNGTAVPNKFFGNPTVRKALTYAINRKVIIESFLKNFGQLANSPVSPIFKNALNDNLMPYNYNPEKAKHLLKQAGWSYNNSEGILTKGKLKFAFTLYYTPGNPFRKNAAEIIKNDLSRIGIKVSIKSMEMGKFVQSLYGKKLNAWISGWSVAMPLDLKDFWYSDLEQTPSNLVSYRNLSADTLMNKMEISSSGKKLNNLYKKFEQKIHEDEPATFLYWVDEISASSKNLKNVNSSPLGVMHDCWKWSIE